MTLYMPHGLHVAEIEKMLVAAHAEVDIIPGIIEETSKSPMGAVFFCGGEYRMLLKPPFPFKENPVFRGFDVDILRSLLRRDYMIAVLMVRMGMYAVGVFKGEELLTAKAGTGLVHSRHKKGGSSQQRFARHREKQIETFFTRVCGHVREQVEPYLESLDYVRYGGERITINSFRKQCQFVSKLDKYMIEALLSVREPKRATLKEAVEEVWSSRVIEWNEE
jgi:peptide subunit release factor 1 (eRF1)